MKTQKKYDVAIIGSGMGGLASAVILAKKGLKVCVLEKNPQIGGNLQIFSRKKTIFDTGVHYLGGLDKGQNLYRYFKYLGLTDTIKYKKMDEDSFDRIHFNDEEKEYKFAQGYPNFIESLSKDFPGEEEAIQQYCDKIREICDFFPLYNLEDSTGFYEDQSFLEIPAKQYIDSLTENVRLRNVLGGNNMLYAGVGDKSPFYVHALVVNSYIESSYKVVDGGSHIAKELTKTIRSLGGELFKRSQVIGATYEGTNITEVQLENGETVKADNFIANIPPRNVIDVFGEDRFKRSYIKRIKSLEETISSFTLHLVFKPGSFSYLNYNIYHFEQEDLWDLIDYDPKTWPHGYMMCTPYSSRSDNFAEGASIMAYMSIDEMKPWNNSFNTIEKPSERGESYEAFKKEKAEKLINLLEKKFPQIRDCIEEYYTSTPLTFRDYIGNESGSLYGLLKDYNSPLKTYINPRTKIPNLYLTGQNLNLHGILGATVSAVVTCSELVDKQELINEIREASE